MKKSITVFTPTYNRAHLLGNLYESLLKQKNKDFEWLIIDDGSVDETKELVEGWIAEGKVDIHYVYKENGGLHTGYNKAIELMDTELSICIDSDDCLVEDGIEKILIFWNKNKSEEVAGIIGLDIDTKGTVIAGELPPVKTINPIYLLAAKENGDRKYVVRNDCYKKVYPMPVFKGEKNFNPHYMILKLCREYEFLIYNEPLCVVDYQPDGMSANIYHQYLNSPKSFAELRRVILEIPCVPFKYMIKTVIHYVSSSFLARNKRFIQESPKKFWTIVLTPFGIAVTFLIKKRAK